VGLACLGKRGIQGKLLRRVMAPGTPMANQLGKGAEGSIAEAMAATRWGECSATCQVVHCYPMFTCMVDVNARV
jgi:hypothetical protein